MTQIELDDTIAENIKTETMPQEIATQENIVLQNTITDEIDKPSIPLKSDPTIDNKQDQNIIERESTYEYSNEINKTKEEENALKEAHQTQKIEKLEDEISEIKAMVKSLTKEREKEPTHENLQEFF